MWTFSNKSEFNYVIHLNQMKTPTQMEFNMLSEI